MQMNLFCCVKKDFMLNESKKERPYPKKFDIAVPANMKCGKIDN